MTCDVRVIVLLKLMVSILLGTQRLRGKRSDIAAKEPSCYCPRMKKELCPGRRFKCFPSVYAVCWQGML